MYSYVMMFIVRQRLGISVTSTQDFLQRAYVFSQGLLRFPLLLLPYGAIPADNPHPIPICNSTSRINVRPPVKFWETVQEIRRGGDVRFLIAVEEAIW